MVQLHQRSRGDKEHDRPERRSTETEFESMLRLFEKDKDYGVGMEFKPVSRLDLDNKAVSILRERGHVVVQPHQHFDGIINQTSVGEMSVYLPKRVE